MKLTYASVKRLIKESFTASIKQIPPPTFKLTAEQSRAVREFFGGEVLPNYSGFGQAKILARLFLEDESDRTTYLKLYPQLTDEMTEDERVDMLATILEYENEKVTNYELIIQKTPWTAKLQELWDDLLSEIEYWSETLAMDVILSEDTLKSMYHEPFIKDQRVVDHIVNNLLMQGSEVDWRPSETLPEDDYGF